MYKGFYLALVLTITSCFELFGPPVSLPIKVNSNNAQNKKAVLLNLDGDATVDRSLQVSVVDINYEFRGNEIGNTFSVDGNYGTVQLDSNSVQFMWKGNDTLEINYNQKLRTFTQNKNVNNTIIVYNPR